MVVVVFFNCYAPIGQGPGLTETLPQPPTLPHMTVSLNTQLPQLLFTEHIKERIKVMGNKVV